MTDSASLFAYLVLLGWPLVAIFLFSRLPLAEAMLWTIIGGYLLLPLGAEIKFQMIPAINKTTVPNIAALIGCVLSARRAPRFTSGFGWTELLVVCVLGGPFITSMLNEDSVRIADTVLPGVGAYDAGSAAIFQFLTILPFFLGRQFLRSAENNLYILRVLVIAGLAYSVLMLIEIRMSPQFSSWIYGYSHESFSDEYRYFGFRPIVFLTNGLMAAFFAATAAIAAASLWRTQVRAVRYPPGAVAAYLGFVSLLCRSLGASVYTVVMMALVRWTSARLKLGIACTLVLIALTYPALRLADLIPTTTLISMAGTVSADRAASLNTRFVQEDRLLKHAWQRPWFGWGRFGRSRVYEKETGIDVSITDGYWVITMGVFGLVGFIAQFGLFALAVFRAAGSLKFATDTREREWLAALALIVAVNVIDLLPNASVTPLTWLFVGALLGRAEALRAAARRRRPAVNSLNLQSLRAQNQFPQTPADVIHH